MSKGTNGCMYNCGDSCSGECMKPTDEIKLKEQTEQLDIPISNSIPTKWAKIEEIETWVGGKTYEGKGGRARLIVTHYCGDSKEDLIGQLETLIYGLKNGFDCFAS